MATPWGQYEPVQTLNPQMNWHFGPLVNKTMLFLSVIPV